MSNQGLSKTSRVISGLFLLFAAVLIPAQLLAGGTIQPEFIEPKVGDQYYTRYNFKEEKSKHNTTNYWRGNLVAINTKVTLLSIGRKKMVIETEDGRKVTFVNVKKYTKRNLNTIASELLSPKPIPLEKLSKSTKQAVEAGELTLGMSKGQVIMARGYPPRHKTPTLDQNTWTYWSSRFVQRTLKFQDGVLSEGRGL